MLEPRIETKPAILVMGLQAAFIAGRSPDSNAGEIVGPLWSRFHARQSEVEAVEPGVYVGWSFLGPPDQRAREDEVEYVAGVQVTPGCDVPDGMVAIETAAGLYAVFEHRGAMSEFAGLVRSIYGEWLPTSGCRGNGLGDLERYDSRGTDDGACATEGSVEYWLGIEPEG